MVPDKGIILHFAFCILRRNAEALVSLRRAGYLITDGIKSAQTSALLGHMQRPLRRQMKDEQQATKVERDGQSRQVT